MNNLTSVALRTGVAVALLAGCSGNGSSPSSSRMMPGGVGSASKLTAVDWRFAQIHRTGFHGRHAPKLAAGGIYTNDPSPNDVLGYLKKGGTCIEITGGYVNGIGVDFKGNLIVPDGFNNIQVYQGPMMCGPLLMTITDSIGQAADAAAKDAVNGTIVVGHANGTVAACKSSGCRRLTSPNMIGFAQVAMDKNGNCYADAYDVNTSSPALWYYAGCTPRVAGIELGSAQGFTENATGGIDIDNKQNVVVLEQGAPSRLTVYSDCGSGTCTLVTGPTPLIGYGDCVYGHLSSQNERYACGDASTGTIDIYNYLPSRTPSYLYSITNGFSSGLTEDASYNPPSQSK
ncbi:MAG TPA: hypothetical protein VFE35_05180 [Candidatus Cybelea sp.]|nr:hypothetical protein [Candidatus Cybelea sp.]